MDVEHRNERRLDNSNILHLLGRPHALKVSCGRAPYRLILAQMIKWLYIFHLKLLHG